MSSDIDILTIDAEIHRNFQTKLTKISEYKNKLQKLETYKSTNDLHTRIHENVDNACKSLQKKIHDIENNQELSFYIAQTSELLTKYRTMLSIPMKMSFIGKPIKNDKEKQIIINQYLDIAKSYIEISKPQKNLTTSALAKPKITCDNCPNKTQFDIIDGDTYICLNCFSQQFIFKHNSSYKDSDRININTKYIYDRRIHFRDSINQFQGKQNSTIEDCVYQDLEKQLENHYLLIGDKNTDKKERYKNITKEHIMIFLKDLGYTKHYENINLIHYTLTGKKPDDIGYLEDQLIQDFDELTALYDIMFKDIDRKNFINTQFCLYNLLTRHKHPCKKEDFSILKTIDRKNFHDDICKALFEALGWNFSASF